MKRREPSSDLMEPIGTAVKVYRAGKLHAEVVAWDASQPAAAPIAFQEVKSFILVTDGILPLGLVTPVIYPPLVGVLSLLLGGKAPGPRHHS
jgi:hypothetical protein